MTLETKRNDEYRRLTEMANKMAGADGNIHEKYVPPKAGRQQSADAAVETGRTVTKEEFVTRGMAHFDAEHS